tara:strand:- start:427 stop:1605 length:1179 start_codon:yes stop_codon:yes gene_type:complete
MKVYIGSFLEKFKLSGEHADLQSLIRQLKLQKVDVRYISENSPKYSGNNFVINKTANLLLGYFGESLKLLIKIRKLPSGSIVLIQLPSPGFAILTDFLKALTAKKEFHLVVLFAGVCITEPAKVFKDIFSRNCNYYFIRLLINNQLFPKLYRFNADAYVATSELHKNQLLQFGVCNEKIIKINNVFDKKFQIVVEEEINKKRKSYSILGKSLTYIGHFLHNKGVDVAIKAFSEYSKIDPGCKLILCWSGLGDIELVKKNIAPFKGKVVLLNEVEIGEIFSISNILLAPYLYDNATNLYPRILLEAFAFGIPVISTDILIIKELCCYKGEETLLMAKPSDPKDLVRLINILINDKLKISKMIKAQKDFMENRFASDKTTTQFIKLFESLQNGN